MLDKVNMNHVWSGHVGGWYLNPWQL